MSLDVKRPFRSSDSLSDSDGSEEDSASLASYNQVDGGSLPGPGVPTVGAVGVGSAATRPGGVGAKKRGSGRKSRQEWDVVEGLKDGQRCEEKPERFQGYLMKRRKWPMKGWHKRFFVLERGILTYAKSGTDIQRGKYHGIMDIGLAVIIFKKQGQRIDIDAEEQVHHIKVKDPVLFDQWLSRLRHHRLYRQHELLYGVSRNDVPRLAEVKSPVEERPALATANLPELALSQTLNRGNVHQASFKGSQGRVTNWHLDSGSFEQTAKNLQTCQEQLNDLRLLLDKIQALPISSESAALERADSCESDVVVRKKRVFRPYKRRDRKSDSYGGTTSIASSIKDALASSAPSTSERPNSASSASSSSKNRLAAPATDRLKASASNPNLLTYQANGGNSNHQAAPSRLAIFNHKSGGSGSSTNISSIASGTPAAGGGGDGGAAGGGDSPSSPMGDLAPHELRIQEIKLRENFVSSAEAVHARLKDLTNQLSVERDRVKTAKELDSEAGSPHISSLKIALLEAQKQNSDLRARLARIHADSAVTPDTTCTPGVVLSPLPGVLVSSSQDKVNLVQSLSLDSFSMSEYYDAEENFADTHSDTSSEPSDEDASSDVSEDGNDTDHTTGGTSLSEAQPQPICATGRRSRLPVPKPETPDVSMWNLLYRNMGKDLTKISMPVTLNEPLSMLQHLCEELEYSELLDKAAEYDDPYERMIYVAAFAVSSYASSYYREGKPFNPLLGETYECIREDKGWRFIAEQVCHHPPIGACHCESKNFIMWQDTRIKTKFWGKSMEITPVGHVHCILPKYRDHYKWNKVTTCVHNLLGGHRWADQYGEMTITNGNIICKLTFTKGTYNSSPKRYEVYGSINTSDGKVVHNLFGKWNEAFFCGHASSAKCVWRPGAMPEDYEQYYGFTRFAIELNELDQDLVKFLPPTDTRFRPDQRLLEEGKIAEAESEKHRLENAQRERRKSRESSSVEHKPLWFKRTIADGKTEVYEYSGKYWDARKDPGFNRMSFVKIF